MTRRAAPPPPSKPKGWRVDRVSTRIAIHALAWEIEKDGELFGRVVDRTPYDDEATDPEWYEFEAQFYNAETQSYDDGPTFRTRRQAIEFITDGEAQ